MMHGQKNIKLWFWVRLPQFVEIISFVQIRQEEQIHYLEIHLYLRLIHVLPYYSLSISVVTKVASVLMIMQMHQKCSLRDFCDLLIVVGGKRIRQEVVHFDVITSLVSGCIVGVGRVRTVTRALSRVTSTRWRRLSLP